jgi:hypothetical protein
MPDPWPARVRATVERLQKEVEQHPSEIYYRLCLAGWLRELQQLEQTQSQGETT